MFDLVGLYVVRCLAAFLCRLPAPWALEIGAMAGRLLYFARRHKAISYLNLKAALGDILPRREIQRIAQRSFENLGRSVVEILRFPVTDKPYFACHVKFFGLDRVWSAREKHCGLIYLSPHFGNWEFLAAVSASVLALPVKILTREQRWQRFNQFLNDLRYVHGTEAIGRKSSVKEFVLALHRDSVVAITADQTTKQGVPVTFFGRKTLAPVGFIKIARRTGAPILPIFDVRVNKGFHEINILPEFSICGEDDSDEQDQRDIQSYYQLLEEYIRRYPDQWLWEHKRWKHCFTKTVLVLSDGKAGHEGQSRFVMNIFKELAMEKPPLEVKMQVVAVSFKSSWHRTFLNMLFPVMLPWIRGRMGALRSFLTEESFEALSRPYVDFVVSCGSSLLALNLLVSKESKAHSIALMKPRFPFSLFPLDLVIAPSHDQPVRGREVVYTEVAPHLASEDLLAKEGEHLRQRLGLNGKKIVSIFVGGDTHRYFLKSDRFQEALNRILEIVKDSGSQILVTTSRRTSAEIAGVVKQRFSGEKCCRLMVIANEANIENITYGMIGAANVIFVTEDSVSMISEAASSGKKVIILKVGAGKLPAKFERFQSILAGQHCAEVLSPHEITSDCLHGIGVQGGPNLVREAKKRIKMKLEGML